MSTSLRSFVVTSARPLALRSIRALRSLSSLSLVITTLDGHTPISTVSPKMVQFTKYFSHANRHTDVQLVNLLSDS